ncbi:sodium/potassium-transporting ATPase subunit gamma-like isoform X1 [Paramormyrops kingsleyae]|uniref:sodium/potassium-transporting ATPase subunit gamma-like isoform X1 n=1 Tax=Paramormyrops kingsleyae TaxID=1676925 RepID=UPI000CD5F009|nr:sodium/potassium-transporting ATPase subunit gamma-like isoform X1 [Paramormyrops kingsleyae]
MFLFLFVEDMDLSVVLVLCSTVALTVGSAFGREMMASTNDEGKEYDSAFEYDYESLRIGGLIFALVLFLLGIILILSKKCRCASKKQRNGNDA